MKAFRLVLPLGFALALGASGASAAMLHVDQPGSRPAVQTVADQQMTVSVSAAVLRAKPTTQSAKLATLKKGTKVDVVEIPAGGSWAHVKVDGKDGYIATRLLS